MSYEEIAVYLALKRTHTGYSLTFDNAEIRTFSKKGYDKALDCIDLLKVFALRTGTPIAVVICEPLAVWTPPKKE